MFLYNFPNISFYKYYVLKKNINNQGLAHNCEQITKNYNIAAVEKITSYMKSYEEQDKKTLFHGDHININKGKTNSKYCLKNMISVQNS